MKLFKHGIFKDSNIMFIYLSRDYSSLKYHTYRMWAIIQLKIM